MSISLTVAAANATYSGLAAAVNNCFVKFWSGPVPANASAAVDVSCVLLDTLTNNDDGSTHLTWNSAGVANGVLQKTTAEVWKGTPVASGTRTFFRIVIGSDAGTAAVTDTTTVRIQGTVGTDGTFDYFTSNPAVTTGTPVTCSTFQILMPQS